MKPLGRTGRLLATLGFSTLVSSALFILRAIGTQSDKYWFLLWNLWLAWVPIGLAWLLRNWMRQRRWLTWQGIGLTFLWLGFLPNTFYLVSDLIHIRTSDNASLMYDTAMLMSFAVSGLILGYTSVYFMHRALLRRAPERVAHGIIGLVLFASSFAIYLGRDLRWNSWDIFVNPAGLLFDISDRFIHPSAHPQAFSTTAVYFVLLSSIYITLWHFIRIFRQADSR